MGFTEGDLCRSPDNYNALLQEAVVNIFKNCLLPGKYTFNPEKGQVLPKEYHRIC